MRSGSDDGSHTSLWSERAIFRRKMLSERPGHWAKLKHHFVPNVKFSRLQRSLKKIHSEELYSGTK